MIPKRKKRQKFGIRPEPQPQNRAHEKFVRGFTCAVAHSGGCGGRTEAHHVREGYVAGMGQKPPAEHLVPLCATHHHLLHNGGAVTFAKAHGVDVLQIAERLAKQSPHLKEAKA